MKAAICLPAYGTPSRAGAKARELLYLGRPNWPRFDVEGVPNLDIARAAIAAVALANDDADVLLWIDDDITFRAVDAIALVKEAFERRAIVGTIYAKKAFGAGIVAMQQTDGERVECFQGGGVYPMRAVGLGLCAVHREVFERIDAPSMIVNGKIQVKPWFTPKTDGSWSDLLPDDSAFCRRAAEAGVGVFADSRVRVGHDGRHEFMLEDGARQLERAGTLILASPSVEGSSR